MSELLTPAKPVFRKRRRLPLAAERQARRRKSSTTWGPSRSDHKPAAAPADSRTTLVVRQGGQGDQCGTGRRTSAAAGFLRQTLVNDLPQQIVVGPGQVL